MDIVHTRRSKRLQASQALEIETVPSSDPIEVPATIDEEEGVQEIPDAPAGSDDEVPAFGEGMTEAREKTPEPLEDDDKTPTPKKMWRKRLLQESYEDLPDTHLPDENRGSAMSQPSLVDSQDDDVSQGSLMSQLPESQESQEAESQEAESQEEDASSEVKSEKIFSQQQNNIYIIGK